MAFDELERNTNGQFTKTTLNPDTSALVKITISNFESQLVRGIQMHLHSPLLRWMTLIDTPGLGKCHTSLV